MSTIVHVIGTGTIGEPLIGLLADYKEELGFDEVTFHKRQALVSDRPKLENLIRRGARLTVNEGMEAAFSDLGHDVSYVQEEAIERATVVVDCTPVGNEMKEKLYRKFEENTKGFIAQGSEFGFGKPYARGINDKALVPGEDRYIQVVSCNTHNLSVLLNNIPYRGQEDWDNLVEAKFLCMRRSNDISQTGRFVPSPTVGIHSDPTFGTHHARDAHHLFKTLGVEPNVFSSALKLNTQYMHQIWFQFQTRKEFTTDEVLERLRANDRVSLTEKMAANLVFSFGRDHGHYGRILNQTVIPYQTLAQPNPTELVGFCFTPQDGNSVLSTISAACWFADPETYDDRIQCLTPWFFDEV